ncbi:MAG: hypothetical protein NTY59_07740 [Alphaproteobacteria bacterium]|nr:hypothetical protein [Alphaproteobacteria bacterium]
MAERTIEIARTALEAAWARARDNPSAETGVAYADAHAAWTDLARRRVGRPASSDGAALTGPERAQALRGRQQDSAGKWTRVAPVIQSLRGAVRAGDLNAVSAAVRALVNETSVTLDRITVIHAHPSSDQTVLEGWDGDRPVLGFVALATLAGYFGRADLTPAQANLLVGQDLAPFARAMEARLERGDYRPYARGGVTVPCIDILLSDFDRGPR